MAATKREKVSIDIPHDLIFNILSKLPIKSLKRFSCVTPSWENLFKNLNFMRMYQNKFLSNDTSIFLVERIPPSPVDNAFMLSGERFNNKVKLDWPPAIHDDNFNYISKLGDIVNDIVCLYNGSWFGPQIELKVVLWNLSNNESKVIPHGYVHCPPRINIMPILRGFGYDNFTNDYKIIHQLYFFDDNIENRDEEDPPLSSLQIYSINSNSWKTLDVEMTLFERPLFEGNDNVYLNGMCHWWGSEIFNEGLRETVLVSFNLSDEVCYTTQLNWRDYYDKLNNAFMAMNDSIAMITLHKGTTWFDILILGEISVRESWTKIFTIGPLPCVSYPIGVCKRGKTFFKKNDAGLYWFDLRTQVTEEIGVQERGFLKIAIYKESLLHIG